MAADPHEILAQINQGNFKLRPTKTVDKSVPFIRSNKQDSQDLNIAPVVVRGDAAPPAPPPPPISTGGGPPPPPPMAGAPTLGKSVNQSSRGPSGPDPRDALLADIQKGRRLRKVQTVDKSAPVVSGGSGSVNVSMSSQSDPSMPVNASFKPTDAGGMSNGINDEVKSSKHFQRIQQQLAEEEDRMEAQQPKPKSVNFTLPEQKPAVEQEIKVEAKPVSVPMNFSTKPPPAPPAPSQNGHVASYRVDPPKPMIKQAKIAQNGTVVSSWNQAKVPISDQSYQIQQSIDVPPVISEEPLSWKQRVVALNEAFPGQNTPESPRLLAALKFPDVLPSAPPEVVAKSLRPDVLSSKLVADVPRSPPGLSAPIPFQSRDTVVDPMSTESWKQKFTGSPESGSEKSSNMSSSRSPSSLVSMDYDTSSTGTTGSEDVERVLLSQTLPSVQSLKGNFEGNGAIPERSDRQIARAKVVNVISEATGRFSEQNGNSENTFRATLLVPESTEIQQTETNQEMYRASKVRILPDVNVLANRFEANTDTMNRATPFTNITGSPIPYSDKVRSNSAIGSVTISVAPPSCPPPLPTTEPPRQPRVVSTATTYINGGGQTRRESEPAPTLTARRVTVAMQGGVPVRVETPWVVKKSSVPQVAGTPEIKAKLQSMHFTALAKQQQRQTVETTLTSNGNGNHGEKEVVNLEELETMNAVDFRQNYQFNIDVNNPDQLIQIQQR